MKSIPEEIDFYKKLLTLLKNKSDLEIPQSLLDMYEWSQPSVSILLVQRILHDQYIFPYEEKTQLLLHAYMDLFKIPCEENYRATVACIGELHRLLAPQWPYFIWLRPSMYLLNTHDDPRSSFGLEYEKLAWTRMKSKLCPMSIFLQNKTEWEIYEHEQCVNLFLVKPKIKPEIKIIH